MTSARPSSEAHARPVSRRPSAGFAPRIIAVLGWCGVVYIELHRLPRSWVLIYLVPPFEAAIWMTAGLATIYLARGRFLPSILTRSTLALIIAVGFVHFNNWAFLEPRSYYATHRGSFEQVAKLVRSGELGRSDEYLGESLPLHLADLSANGKVVNLGVKDGKPVVFLPQWFGIPDDAGGYVCFDGAPTSDLEVDLYGRYMSISDMRNLGDGWWYA